MKSMKTAVLAASFVVSLAAAAQATTITTTFEFDKATTGTQTSLPYTVDGLGLTLTTTGGNGKIATWNGSGLGAPTDSHHQVDSKGVPETINFMFDKMVSIVNVTFNPTYVHSWDKFELSENGGSLGVQSVQPSVNVSTGSAMSFGIGAVGSETFWTYHPLHKYSSKACYKVDYRHTSRGTKYKETCYSAFKITSVTVKWNDTPAVPLPAAGWMLLAGIGGLAAVRRKRRDA